MALKNILPIDKKYKLNVNNKTNKNEINEIEIKVIDLESDIGSDYTILTIHMFLTTALIQCKGINLLYFKENIFPKMKGLVNKLTDVLPISSASTINIDNAYQVARENKLPVPPQAQIQSPTKLKSTVYTNENQTKDNKQPHILPTSTLDKKAYKPEHIVDIPNLETSTVDLCQSFGKFNPETLLKKIVKITKIHVCKSFFIGQQVRKN